MLLSVLLIGCLAVGLLPVPAAASGNRPVGGSSFTDVSPSHWAYTYIQYACENELMNGTGNAVFSPEAATTRGMIVTILYRIEGQPDVGSHRTFSDVPGSQWYSAAILWADSNSIAGGYGDGRFGPNDPIAQLFSFLDEYILASFDYHHDSAGNITSVSSGGKTVATLAYTDGKCTSVSFRGASGANAVHFAYDAAGRIVSAGYETQYTFTYRSDGGYVVSAEAGRFYFNAYGLMTGADTENGCDNWTLEADGTRILATYDDYSPLPLCQFDYTGGKPAACRLREPGPYTDGSDWTTLQYAYNADGRLSEITAEFYNGQCTREQLTYSGGRLSNVYVTDGDDTYMYAFTYLSNGLIGTYTTTTPDRTETIQFTYDEIGRPVP